jgi:hypothetical protein
MSQENVETCRRRADAYNRRGEAVLAAVDSEVESTSTPTRHSAVATSACRAGA